MPDLFRFLLDTLRLLHDLDVLSHIDRDRGTFVPLDKLLEVDALLVDRAGETSVSKRRGCFGEKAYKSGNGYSFPSVQCLVTKLTLLLHEIV